jgi:hypothetical protein
MIENKQLIQAIILASVLFISGCAGSNSILPEKFVAGNIVVVGNEPFTKLALQTGPSGIILLDCDKETKDFLLNNQGRNVKIFYEKRDDDKAPNVVYVKKYELISKEIQ